MDLYERARKLAVDGLMALCINGKKKAFGPELLEWVKKYHSKEFSEVQASWPSFLTRAAQEQAGQIMREPGSYGYMLRPNSSLSTSEEPAVDPMAVATSCVTEATPFLESDRTKIAREKRLYQIFADWLASNDYQAEDTSAQRRGGAWGNPDVVGIRSIQTISGTVAYEVATIEAKVSLTDWKRQFFEAVSHKRFSDRVYFAFAHGADTPTVSDLEKYHELRAYAEKYRIGVVVVFFDPGTYEKLRTGNESDLDSLSLDEGRVEEVWPAILDPSSTFSRDEFVKQILELKDLAALYAFGRKS